MTREISLSVNESPVPLDSFVQGFIDHTLVGMMSVLKGAGEIDKLELAIDGDNVTINLNSAPLPLNYFVNEIIGNTIKGMVSSLKGVSEINKLKLTITG